MQESRFRAVDKQAYYLNLRDGTLEGSPLHVRPAFLYLCSVGLLVGYPEQRSPTD